MADDLMLNRRELLTTLGAGFFVVITPAEGQGQPTRFHVGDDGTVTVFTGKVELGQGARTEITQAVAEELRISPAKVRVLMADTELVPDDGGTSGSSTTPRTIPAIRKAAAALREKAASGEITPPDQWKVLGTSLPAIRGREIVTGALRYSSDLKPAPLLHGKIVRAPAYRATLVSFDAAAAAKMPGVKVVRQENMLGVVAPDAASARRAAAAIKAEWKTEPLPDESELFALFKAKAREGRPNAKGDVAAALKTAARRHQGTYSLPYIQHTPMEPRAAVAAWDGDKLTVHTGSSGPFGVRRQLAEAFRLPETNVRVIVSETGISFGGKHTGECALEAARLAREAGQPVRLAWTREEEFTCAYARPAGVIEIRSGTTEDGKIVAWDFHNYNSGGAAIEPPYDIPNVVTAFHATDSPLKQGSYRSLAAVANAFARETHIEELAAIHRLDPLEFRLRNITNDRLRTVLQRAAESFGWGRRKSGAGIGFGLACNIDKNSLVGLCAEVETGAKGLKVRRITVAFDCGAVLNPDNLRNQIAGCMSVGIGGALFEHLRFDRQKIVNGRLSQYRVPRFSDLPEIDILLVDRKDITSAGAGETPITAVAPAIGAALFAATGQRKRNLPLLG